MIVLSKSLKETEELARGFVDEKLRPRKTSQATIVGLFGDLGSGKTTFSQALGRGLGVSEFMTSPTFVIEKMYKLNGKNHFKNLVHIDAYRLENGHELEVLGFKELIKEPGNLILIEWPERVADILPPDLIKVNFKFVSENEREIGI